MTATPAPWRWHRTRVVVIAACCVPVLAGVGYLTAKSPLYGLMGAGLLLLLGLSAMNRTAVPIFAMPVLVVVARLGGGGVDLSISDFVLFGAFWPALLMGPRPFSKPLISLLWLSALYQGSTLFTVIFNPYRANLVEWFHEWLLISGALVVGWAVGRSGYARLATSMLLLVTSTLALAACATAIANFARGDFTAVNLLVPYYMNKNYLGCVFAFAAIVCYQRPSWLAWRTSWSVAGFAICGLGTLAVQSRQGVVSLGIALIVIAFRPDPSRKRSKAVLWLLLPAFIYVLINLQDQLASGNRFNSANQRLTWFNQSLDLWRHYPIFGAGLRWWYTTRFSFAFQPPNAEYEVLTSAGLIGLAGFLIMFAGMLLVLWRIDPRYGTLAFVLVLSRFVQGQLDLFWVAAQVPIPLALAGICLGVMARDRAAPTRPDGLEWSSPSRPPKVPAPKTINHGAHV